MRKLFFDIQITGHHTEYISHLIDYLKEIKEDTEYLFVVNPDFPVKFVEIYNKGHEIKGFQWIIISHKEYEYCTNKSVFRNSFSFFSLANKYANRYEVDHVCLLYFNIFQLAAIFYRTSYSISGILFLQFYRMNKNSFKEKLKYYRKYFTTKLYLLNSNIDKIFILNDNKTVDFLNKEFKTSVFRMLPDPIPQLKPLTGFDIYGHYGIEKNRKIFLHIGSLGDRKGTFEVVDSATNFLDKNQLVICLLIVGKAQSANTENIIRDKIAFNSDNSKVQIIWDNQFVTNEMMKSLFDQSHFVLMPYKNTEASSGILGHAVAANKKVIATGKGLLKEIIEENKLGVLLEDVTPIEIASKIKEVLENNISLNNSSKLFLKEHTTQKFAALLLHKNQE